MTDTVKLPGLKKPANKWLVYGLAGGTALLAYLWWRNRSSGSASTSGTGAASGTAPGTGTGTDPFPWDGTYGNPSDPYSMDPGTGQTYGDEGGGTGGGGAGGGGGGGGGTSGPPFSTNNEWARYAENHLPHTGTERNAIGLYLAGRPLDPAQQQIVYDAIAVAGDPPVAGPGNYPPNLRGNGHKGGGTTAENPVKGLRQTGHEGATGADIAWDASAHATGYKVTSDKGRVEMTGKTTARIRDVGPHHGQATVHVLARPAAAGARPAQLVVHVGK